MRLYLHSTVDLGEIAIRNLHRGLVADSKLETSGAPVDKLDSALGPESGDSVVSIVRNNVTTVEQASGHVFAVARVTLDHLGLRLEAVHGHLHNAVGFMTGLGSGNNGRISDKREVNSGVGHQVGLEFVQVDIERSIESKRGSDGRNDYRQQLASAKHIPT